MKTRLLVLSLCISSMSLFAQSTHEKAIRTNMEGCKVFPHMPARAVPVFPKTAYTPLEDPSCPPCYEYRSKYGYQVMECPFLRFAPEHSGKEEPMTGAITVPERSEGTTIEKITADALEAQTQKAYTGNYPSVCRRDPNMPAGAVPVWPKSEYTSLEDPSCPPCYEYRSKHGYMVMECPFLRFPAEHTRK